jgi:(E)-4-hydroxy-3-methylbut-2-enyl-diphosphate synthase
MTTSNTRDVQATIEQILRLADAGCEIARVTVQGKKEAEACEGIKNGLIRRGYSIPLVADIHFYPPAALLVAEFADKVRINPGNFVDKRASFKIIEYTDEIYARELIKIEEGFSPLVEKCKRLKKAIRIGTNHGSLSDRIMNRFGDSPKGMVESALEFARICRKHDFHDLIFSMKASNPIVMMQAYRLLVAEMIQLGWDYPLHLGVTEAGEGEDGRVKSAMGIGALLLDGIGDTIRISLTEDPWTEIDPCKRLVRFFETSCHRGVEPFSEAHRDISHLEKRPVFYPAASPLHRDGSVILKIEAADLLKSTFLTDIGCRVQLGLPQKTIHTVDALWIDAIPQDPPSQLLLEKILQAGIGLICPETFPGAIRLSNLSHAKTGDAILLKSYDTDWEKLKTIRPALILFHPTRSPLHETRCLADWLYGQEIPLILAFHYGCDEADLPIHAGAELGALLCDQLAQGVSLLVEASIELKRRLSFSFLQCARMRTTKTDFISCPGCGRTLFELQEVSRRIREKTAHLPGVKIAIMGCIVNGPGEMADADFGYVGSKPGKIDLYVGKTCVQRDIEFDEADKSLIDLIKAHGKWVEPEECAACNSVALSRSQAL